MTTRVLAGAMMAALAISMAACKNQTQVAETPAAVPAADASHEGHTMRAYFVEPKNGATVKSPVKFVFASDQFQISPVPQGEVKEARAGMGHFHLGVDTDCLAPGTAIPKAEAGATPGVAGSWI